MKQTQTIPETFLGVGYTRDQAGLPLEAVRVSVPQPAADQVLIRVAASSLNPLEYKLADLNFNYKRDDIAAEIAKLTSGRGMTSFSTPPTASRALSRPRRPSGGAVAGSCSASAPARRHAWSIRTARWMPSWPSAAPAC